MSQIVHDVLYLQTAAAGNGRRVHRGIVFPWFSGFNHFSWFLISFLSSLFISSQLDSMVEIKRTDIAHTPSTIPDDSRYRLIYSKSKVYVNPTAYARDNIPGFIALVKRASPLTLPSTLGLTPFCRRLLIQHIYSLGFRKHFSTNGVQLNGINSWRLRKRSFGMRKTMVGPEQCVHRCP